MEKNYVSPNYALDVYYQLPCIDQCMTGEEWKLFTVLFNHIMIVTQHDKIKVEPIEIKHEWIANKIGKNTRTSIRNVERLRQLGVIKVMKACRNSNKYELNWNVINAIAQSQIENMDKIVTNTCDKIVTNTNIHDKNVTDDMDKNVTNTCDKNVTNTDNTCDKIVTNTCDKNVSTIGDKNVTQIINNINKEKENKENPENPVIENPETNSFSDSEVNEIIDSPNNLQKEKENTENPVNGNQKSNFISDFSNSVDSPNIVDETDEDTDNPKCDSPKSNSDSKSKPYRVNLNYIDDLERQFNGYTDATSPNLTSDYIKSIPCMHINLSILNDLIEASKRPTLVIDAMEKSIELLHTYRGGKGTGLFYIAQVYDRASQTIKSKNGMSEKQLKLATDKLAALKKDIVDCGGAEELRLAQTVQ